MFSRRTVLKGAAGVAVCFIASTGMALSAFAMDPKAPEAVALLSKVETALNDIKTMKSRFIQTNPDGSYYNGTIWIDRPGRMRIEYDPPVPLLLVATGTLLITVDTELDQVTHLPLSSTPAYFLLRDEISFSRGLRVTGVEDHAGLIDITLIQEDAPEAGQVRLALNDNPVRLKQWTITDAQGLNTTVTLMGPEYGVSMNEEMFRYHYDASKRDPGK